MDQDFYSLWLVPDENTQAYRVLTKLMQDLRQRSGSPMFVPHITLLPDVTGAREEIIEKIQLISQETRPFEVRLEMGDYTDGLYQTLVARVTMTSALRDINKKTRTLFGRHGDSLYVPHVSLVYKTGLDNQVKDQLVQEIEPTIRGLSWMVHSVHLYTSSPNIEQWQLVNITDFSNTY